MQYRSIIKYLSSLIAVLVAGLIALVYRSEFKTVIPPRPKAPRKSPSKKNPNKKPDNTSSPSSSQNSPTLKPFISWVGGKQRYLNSILPLIPQEYNTFIEPFVGGGSVFLSLKPSQLIINDINSELITSYQVIRDTPLELIQLLEEYRYFHSYKFFIRLREQGITKLNKVEIAGRFIYLNKASYGGVYRVNKEGKSMPSWGYRPKITLPTKTTFLSISNYLNLIECQILCQDYQSLLPLIRDGDFLFVDPPYDGISSALYTQKVFKQENQRELLNFLKQVENKSANWLMTNKATTFIQELYGNYQQFYFETNTGLNTKKRRDVLITNLRY